MQLRSADLSGEKKKKSWGKKPTTQLLRMVLVSQLLQCRNVLQQVRKERQTVDAKALVLGYRIMCCILKGFISFGMYGGLNLHNLFTILIHLHTLLLQSSPGFSMLMKQVEATQLWRMSSGCTSPCVFCFSPQPLWKQYIGKASVSVNVNINL